MFQSGRGDRSDASNVILLLTAGSSNLNVAGVELEARNARDADIKVVPVGITNRCVASTN